MAGMKLLTEKWDRRFLKMAKLVSTWSKDPSTQTGAVFVRPDRSVISVGYNGFAAGVEDTDERYQDRSIKYEMVIHCEENALISAQGSVAGSCLYTHPFMSCSRCAAKMIQAGVERCVAPEPSKDAMSRWADAFKMATDQFDEAGVELVLYKPQMWIDPPDGWKYGFPKLMISGLTVREFLMTTDYPEEDIELAEQYSQFWED